jgi:hypothetical protein
MIVRAKSRRRSVIALLLTIGLQGVAPDAQSVASLRSLQVLCPASKVSDAFSHDEGFGDAVCGQIRSSHDLGLDRLEPPSFPFTGETLPITEGPRSLGIHACQSPWLETMRAEERPILGLGRLIC